MQRPRFASIEVGGKNVELRNDNTLNVLVVDDDPPSGHDLHHRCPRGTNRAQPNPEAHAAFSSLSFKSLWIRTYRAWMG